MSLHADVRPLRPLAPGKIPKRDNEYKRCGTANVFCAVEPKAGRHFTRPTPDRSAPELAAALGRLASEYPGARTIHLVMDNLNTHCRKSLTDYSGKKQGSARWNRFTVHYTPKHGSWLNQAEIEISMFSRGCLGTKGIPALSSLKRESRAWNRQMNRARVKIGWGFTPKPPAKSLATKRTISYGRRPQKGTFALLYQYIILI